MTKTPTALAPVALPTELSDAELKRRGEIDDTIQKYKDSGRKFVVALGELIQRNLCRDHPEGVAGYLRDRHEISKSYFYDIQYNLEITEELKDVLNGEPMPIRTTRTIHQTKKLIEDGAAIVVEIVEATLPEDAQGNKARATTEDYMAVKEILTGIKDRGSLTIDGQDMSLVDAISYMKNESEAERRKTLGQYIAEERKTIKDKLKTPQTRPEPSKHYHGANSITFHCSEHGEQGVAAMPRGAIELNCECLFHFLDTGKFVHYVEKEPETVRTPKLHRVK